MVKALDRFIGDIEGKTYCFRVVIGGSESSDLLSGQKRVRFIWKQVGTKKPVHH